MKTESQPAIGQKTPLETYVPRLSRRDLLKMAGAVTVSSASLSSELRAGIAVLGSTSAAAERFPYFSSTPVSYLNVKLQDSFWAPRQRTTRDVSLPWITSRHDKAGGIEAFRADPDHYVTQTDPSEMEHIKLIEAMASVEGVQHDAALVGFIDAWAKPLMEGQGSDGYLAEHFPIGVNRPAQRWQPGSSSHEDYTIGHYLESAIAYHEATGRDAMYKSATRAADNMVAALLDSRRTYTSGHPEIEQALMRLYGVTGDARYLRLCGWLLDQRGRHEGRPSFGRTCQDHLPIRDQRTIEGHAVKAAYLFNGATHYVGATGDAGYREAVLAVWEDLEQHKMYLHGASGNQSARNEGYRKNPDCIRPEDVYGESCAAIANFRWAHSLARLTGHARYLDTAERILYNTCAGSLSLHGDSSFYGNPSQTGLPILDLLPNAVAEDKPITRSKDFAISCCPPNIVKLFNTVGGFVYSVASDGIYVNHYAASEAEVPYQLGVKVTQQTQYPWAGLVEVTLTPKRSNVFALRMRVPVWAVSHQVFVNGDSVEADRVQGWVVIRRRWRAGDRVSLKCEMKVERVTMPPQFDGYENRAALQRGPIVYCLEEHDLEHLPAYQRGSDWVSQLGKGISALYIPEEAVFSPEHRADFLGGVTVLKGDLCRVRDDGTVSSQSATFIPYAVWGNRQPSPMSIWLGARKAPLVELLIPEIVRGDTCVG